MIMMEYDAFILQNRIRVNKYLNIALWLFILTGSAIALGIHFGYFRDVTYGTCAMISLLVFVLAFVHLILLKKWPKSQLTGIFALTALNALLVYMNCFHVNIFLTWFLIPLLSLLFCDKKIYFYAIITNYLLMMLATWITASYYVVFRTDYEDAAFYFLDTMGGYTIETFVLFAGSYMISKLALEYFRELLEQNSIIHDQKAQLEEKMRVLNSVVEIYDNVNLVDFVDNTETSLRDQGQSKAMIDMNVQTHTKMNQNIVKQVSQDQREDFLTFTNIKTVRSRLAQKKIISADFVDVVNGWFRAQYITVDAAIDGIPNAVIYTTQNVDEEKRREEHLMRISMTDELTRLYNRRSYEEDLMKLRGREIDADFVLFSVDVNGLKAVNDTMGHGAGDELIKGAANCLSFSVGNQGKAYRIGGDEFMAIVCTDDPKKLCEEIRKKAREWRGIYSEELTMSIGYAAYRDSPNASIDELEHLADSHMYREKEQYYINKGLPQRGVYYNVEEEKK